MKIFITFLFTVFSLLAISQEFIITQNNRFLFKQKDYKFFGTNYWYGGLLGIDSLGKVRLKKELDFLQAHGVQNLRVLIGSEGDSSYPYRISPSLQEKPLQYSEAILKSYDYFLNEASKREMKIVFVLNNNWEWSGGFGQYLEWAGYTPTILPKTKTWDWEQYCEYIAQFYSCDSCQKWYLKTIEKIVLRKNSINGVNYRNDPTIMSWELANEPRPMTQNAISNYKNWIYNTSQYIKSIDKNHLITIGIEGIISTRMDSNLFLEIHSFPSIDYTTIHLWPKTWVWYNGNSTHSISDTTLQKTGDYIALHHRLSSKLNKPLVIEEFGLHRDNNEFTSEASINNRNKYFQYILSEGNKYNVSGYNFWGAFAYRDRNLRGGFWKKGLPYSADPPQEEQGLYGVFLSDSSTWKMITNWNKLYHLY